MSDGRTIVAISSTAGHAARIILRLSGPDAPRIAATLCPDWTLSPARAARTKIAAGGGHVYCWLYSFKAPHSYTGEDLLEFHLPGNEILARLLLDRILTLGARPADPGEFTARAYFNGRMDLTAAEGVAAAVSASNDDELRAARQLMAGALAKRLRPLMDRLAETLGLVEVGIDCSEEDVTFLPQEEVARRAAAIDGSLAELVSESDRLERLSAEPTVVLVGRPNAGKSTLLNALAGHDRAVVSPIAGTTRDLLTADVPLLRGLIRLTDAAGLDDSPTPSSVPSPQFSPAHAHIESEMRRRALEAVQSADLVVLVVAADDDRTRIHVDRGVDLVVHTKSDLASVPIGHLAVCAPTGDGLPRLREKLDELAFGRSTASHRLAINRRHLQHIDAARAALGRVQSAAAVELTALELRDALDSLGAVLGVISPDDVLGLVFSRFCIGK